MDKKNLEVLQQLKNQIQEKTEKEDAKATVIDPRDLPHGMTEIDLRAGVQLTGKEPHERSFGQNPARTMPSSPWPADDIFRGDVERGQPDKVVEPTGLSKVLTKRTSGVKGSRCMFRGVSVSESQYEALRESLAHQIYGDDLKGLTKKFDALTFYLSQRNDDFEAVDIYKKIAQMLILGKSNEHVLGVEDERRVAKIRADLARAVKSAQTVQKAADKNAPVWSKRYCQWCHAEFFIHRDWVKPPTRCKNCRDSFHHTNAPKKHKSGKTVYSQNVIYSGGSPGLGKRP